MQISGYAISEKIYESRRSLIYRAQRKRDGLAVILKQLKNDYPPPEELARFRREYEMTCAIESEGVIKAYELIPYQHSLILVIEDFGGDSLANILKIRKLTLVEFLELAISISDSLATVHARHIMHKDINPSNIVWNRGTGQLKLIDFGISTTLSQEQPELENPNILEGTLAYISPEQTGRMNRAIDYRSDLYSLGISFYEMLAGRRPFECEDALEWIHAHIAKTPIPPYRMNSEVKKNLLETDRDGVPRILSDIIMTLTEKNAEDRYQSASGVKADLQKCLKQLQQSNEIGSFELRKHDLSDKLQVPQKLYGRESDIQLLYEAFERVTTAADEEERQQSELLFITGPAGIGKTSLIYEIRRKVFEKQGYFISGKFDQFSRNVPYSAIISAFHGLTHQILSESEERIARWKEHILQALGVNGQVIIDVIPDLEYIIGKQTAVPDLAPQESQNRFIYSFHQFVQSCATPEHSLVIFLDDLQWADSSSLKLIESWMSGKGLQHTLILGAYRDDELDKAHHLIFTLNDLRQNRAPVYTLTLAPLSQEHVGQLIAETLSCEKNEAGPLTEICFQKTSGNPFFLKQLLISLHESGLLSLDREHACWQWDLENVQEAPISENVVSLMSDKLQRLKPETLDALKFAACIGNQFDLHTLALMSESSLQVILKKLWPALQAGLIFALDNAYKYIDLHGAETSETLKIKHQTANTHFKFLHDRIQQAAYLLISDEHKQEIHLKIGRQLLLNIPEDEREEHIFDIVHHLNLGKALLENQDEKDELAELSLIAGKRAKASAAYQPAFEFLQTGIELLNSTCWESLYGLSLALYEESSEAAYLCGKFEDMEHSVSTVQQQVRSPLDAIKVYEIRIQAYIAESKPRDAVNIGLQLLRRFGVELPQNANILNFGFGLLKIKALLAGRHIEDLYNQPEMTNPYKLAAMRILMSIASASYEAAPKLLPLIVFKAITLSLKYGNMPLSAFGYAGYGFFLCGVLGEIEAGFQFGELAIRLLRCFDSEELEIKMRFTVNALIRHWKEHAQAILSPLLDTYHIGMEAGELEYAGYCTSHYAFVAMSTGKELSQLEKMIMQLFMFMAQFRNYPALYHLAIHHQTVLKLIGKPRDEYYAIGKKYHEKNILLFNRKANDRSALCYAYTDKLISCVLFQKYDDAIENATLASTYLDGTMAEFVIPAFHFYDSLAHLALYFESSQIKQKRFLKKINENQKKMKKWAHHAPMNHLHKWHLVEAERTRVLGKHDKAIEHYDKAIKLAKKHEYLNEEALANELAAKFYQAWGKEKIAAVYMQEALYCYSRWGALAKVKHLEQTYPELLKRSEQIPSASSSKVYTETTHTTMAQGLDLTTIMKAAQTISQNLDRDTLIKMLLERLIENTGAQKVVFIASNKNSLQLEYFLSADEDFRKFEPPLFLHDSRDASAGIVRYVVRTREQLVLHNALEQGDFVQDEYVLQHQIRSLLCLPILYQNTLIGILYLEHRLMSGVFTFERQQVAYVLCAQVAISLELAKQQKAREKQEEERRRYEAIRTANQAKSEFLRTISHEIRNPLNAITLGLSNLNRQIDNPAGRQSYLKRIDASSKILQNLVNSVLDLSSIEASQFNLRLDSFNIRETVATAVEPFQFELKVGVEFVVNINSNIPICLYGDRVRVTQILANLVSNAVKFTESGNIVVNVSSSSLDPISGSVVNAERTWLHFSVQDSGSGIPEEEQARIFEPYFQGREILRHKSRGTGGIGMTIVKKIVNAMGGEISLQSHPGLGTHIHVILPFSACDEAELANQEQGGENSVKLSLRVLIVEDNHSNRFMLSDWLRHVGCQVTEAENGGAALECRRQEAFDVILMDKQMPGMDGIQATRKIREIEKQQGGHTYIIALTASATNSDKHQCLEAGMDDYLAKPVDMKVLLHKLEGLCPENRIEAEEGPEHSGSLKPDDEIESLFLLDKMPESWKNDPAKRKKFIDLMVDDIHQSLRRMEQAIQDRNPTALSKAAHKLKGAVGKIRSESIQELAAEVESMRRKGDLEEASMKMKMLKDELERVLGIRLQ